MDEENNSNVVRRSLPLKIAGISCALLVAAILVLSILSVRYIQTSSLQAAVIMGRNKLAGDIASFEDKLALEHGQISLLNGDLVDEYGNSIKHDCAIVDHIASRLGVQATIYIRDGDDYRRVSTSIIDGYGNRIVDTFLGAGSPAYNSVSSGNDFFGNASVLGIDYLTVHRPLFANNSREVIGTLAIGIEMSAIDEYIDDARNSNIVLIVIGSVIILVLAALVNVAACRIILLKPIRAVMDMLKHLRDGDLTQKLTVKGKDEIGEMADHINYTVEKVKSMVASLEQHGRLLDTVNSAAAVLLSNNAKESFEELLLKSFELVGRCLDVDRVQIWRNEKINGDMHFVLRHEWLSDYGKNCSAIPHGLHFPYSMKPEWESKFLRGENINAPLCELPQEDREFLGNYGMKSIVILPMFLDGDFWGFFSIDDCRNERTFTNEEINILISAGYMMTNAINRNTQALIIREANERIQSIFEATPLAITMWDPETGALIDCNMEAVRLVGLTDKKVYIEKFAEMSPEYQPNGQKTSDMVVDIFDKTMRDGIYRYNWDQKSIDGEVIPFQVNTVRLKHISGYIVISYAQDMRETNAAIAKMREADERVQLMFDALPFGASFWDEDLNIIDCNNEILELFDLSSKQEFIDRFLELSPEYQPDGSNSKERAFEYLKEALSKDYCRFEWVHQKLNGEQIPCEVIFVRIKYRGKYSLTAYVRDLREQKAMMAEMHKAEIAEASNKAKSDFLARMSHEIRTPMNAIMGIADIQLQDETHASLIKEAFERIYNSGGLLLGIINDILDLSKIEAGKLVIIPAQYDIASLIHDIVQINTMRYEAKSIEFVLDVNENLPLLLIGDELRIKQILNNLLSNAFKYTEEGTVKLTVYSEPEDSWYPQDTEDASKKILVFIISDTGQGMTPEQLKKLGTEYSRFNLQANRKIEGTGLGMNITRNLIQLMNGSVSVESAPGAGTTFTVRLPQDCEDSSVIGKEMADNLMRLNPDSSVKIRAFQMKREYMPYGSVLVVDDVETNLYVAKGLMAPYGLSVETVLSGFEAVDKVRDGFTYDIIFMDHMMPRMDGIEAAKIIRGLGYSKPIVALTANALTGQAAMFMENGFDDFISKPIDIRQLNMVLNKLVRDKYPAEVVEAARNQKNRFHSGDEQKKPLEPQLAEVFVRDAKKAMTSMETIYLNKCRRADDVSTFVITIHAMKSALANIGEKSLSSEAARLEEAGRENKTGLILSELPSFMEALHAVIEKLESKEAAGENTEDAGDNQYLKEKLLAVREACALYDKKTAKDTLAEIRGKTWPKPVSEQLSELSAHLLHSDFDEAVQVIDGCVRQL